MDYNKAKKIFNNKEKVDIFYKERPVWIQDINNYTVKIGFIDNFEEREVLIEDLHEQI